MAVQDEAVASELATVAAAVHGRLPELTHEIWVLIMQGIPSCGATLVSRICSTRVLRRTSRRCCTCSSTSCRPTRRGPRLPRWPMPDGSHSEAFPR
jgi:hypothetical protein